MNIEQDLENLHSFQDAELWAVINRRLSATDEHRLHYLGSEEKRGLLTANERQELDHLLTQVNRDMLLRSKALLVLKERGHDINSCLLNPS